MNLLPRLPEPFLSRVRDPLVSKVRDAELPCADPPSWMCPGQLLLRIVWCLPASSAALHALAYAPACCGASCSCSSDGGELAVCLRRWSNT